MEKVIRKKHIWKPKLAKHVGLGALLEVEMSKKCTPVWREAHFQVKMCKAPGVRGSDHFLTIRWQFDVEKVHAVVARSKGGTQNEVKSVNN